MAGSVFIGNLCNMGSQAHPQAQRSKVLPCGLFLLVFRRLVIKCSALGLTIR